MLAGLPLFGETHPLPRLPPAHSLLDLWRERGSSRVESTAAVLHAACCVIVPEAERLASESAKSRCCAMAQIQRTREQRTKTADWVILSELARTSTTIRFRPMRNTFISVARTSFGTYLDRMEPWWWWWCRGMRELLLLPAVLLLCGCGTRVVTYNAGEVEPTADLKATKGNQMDNVVLWCVSYTTR